MSGANPPRRDFLQLSGAAALGTWMAMGLTGCREAADSAAEAIRNGEAPRVLTDEELRTLDALAGRIIPADGDAPGASEAGAAVFMDHFLADQPGLLEAVRGGLGGVDSGFADLSAERQDALVASLETGDPGFFGLLGFLVAAGTFASPARGGNRNKVGWSMLGFDDRHAWAPPFGAYDAQVTEGGDR